MLQLQIQLGSFYVARQKKGGIQSKLLYCYGMEPAEKYTGTTYKTELVPMPKPKFILYDENTDEITEVDGLDYEDFAMVSYAYLDRNVVARMAWVFKLFGGIDV